MGKWVAGAIKRAGQLHRDLKVPQGQKIPSAKLAAAAKQHGKIGQRARLAEEMRGFEHGGKSTGAHPAERPYLHMIPSRRGR